MVFICVEAELERLKIKEQNINMHSDEDEAWKKVTPIENNLEMQSPDTSTNLTLKHISFAKSHNHSEGEISDDNDDDIDVLSSGRRSNYTNTSVIKVNRNHNDDASSQTSGMSGGFAYLNNPFTAQ